MRRGGSPKALKLTAIASHIAIQKIKLAIRIYSPLATLIQAQPAVEGNTARAKAAREGLAIGCGRGGSVYSAAIKTGAAYRVSGLGRGGGWGHRAE
jgi:hypothetical protein